LRIEVFSQARDPARPDSNEDAFVVVPGRAYAVIDGVTDRNGTRYDGMLAGRYAARLVARALQAMFAAGVPDAGQIVPALTGTLRAAYQRHGVDVSASAWGGRMCCTLALAMLGETHMDVLLVGDSGIRLNGATVLQMHKDLDLITALLRRHAWTRIAVRVSDPVERERLARQVVFHGTGQDPAALAPVLDEAALAAIGAEADAACRTALPHVPPADIAFLLRHGIVDGQGTYQNRTDSVLGYASLDGLDIPAGLTQTSRFALRDIQQIELFTDGYVRPAGGFGIAAWEAEFSTTEREDRSKIGAYPGVKGSLPGRWSDDRTYVGVQFDAGQA
jgi:hypothetical protein